ncbi:helix-turn-helix domain-containing protein [Ruminiclostridium cellobioparum]|jgi:transcriptional regulator with XRE-family HTH domain|uniref:helix-turn-helix domain-containing protein n=1 Tax=Ruminiclostridium cellobioparum TaxID=29355 RepID=UPI0004807108|nr:helix-turn-helix transcriptional regulator [Ruminiclostridium cellobioparum]
MSQEEQYSSEIQVMRENFKFMREIRGWSIKELSVLSGIRKNVLEDIENGRNFEVEYIFKLSDFYGIVPHKIFTNKKASGEHNFR